MQKNVLRLLFNVFILSMLVGYSGCCHKVCYPVILAEDKAESLKAIEYKPLRMGPWSLWLSTNQINCLEIKDDFLWCGSNGGLFRYDLKNYTYE